jgi:hypothetical protein
MIFVGRAPTRRLRLHLLPNPAEFGTEVERRSFRRIEIPRQTERKGTIMFIKGTVLCSCALLGTLLASQPARSAEPLTVQTLVHRTDATPATVDTQKDTTAELVGWRHGGWGRGWGGGWGHGWGGGWGRGWGYGRGYSIGIGYGGWGGYYGRGWGGYYGGGYGGYYGRGYYPGYYSYYARPYYGYGNYYPRYYGYNYGYYSPSYVSVGFGGPGYSSYYGGYPYYGTYGYCY